MNYPLTDSERSDSNKLFVHESSIATFLMNVPRLAKTDVKMFSEHYKKSSLFLTQHYQMTSEDLEYIQTHNVVRMNHFYSALNNVGLVYLFFLPFTEERKSLRPVIYDILIFKLFVSHLSKLFQRKKCLSL